MQRRDFLKTACIASAGLVTGCPSTSTGYQAQLQNNRLIVPKSMLSKTDAISVAWGKKNIGLSSLPDGRFVASLLRCTHLGCSIDIDQGGYVCPCHGAKFSRTGEVLQGPAAENLQVFVTSVDDVNVYIHT